MSRLFMPPAPEYRSPITWLYRCRRPVLFSRRCGALLTGYERDKVQEPITTVWKEYRPGPVIRHLPCGHEWWIGIGWMQ